MQRFGLPTIIRIECSISNSITDETTTPERFQIRIRLYTTSIWHHSVLTIIHKVIPDQYARDSLT